MRGKTATLVAATTILLIVVALFTSTPKFSQVAVSLPSVPGHHPYTKPRPLSLNPPTSKEPSGDAPAERRIVKVRLKDEDVSWIDSLFPTWQKELITIAKAFSKLHKDGTTVDKGRIANAYLTYLIENYNNLPETIIFLPPNQESHPSSISSLQISFIQSSGFANLHCPTPSTCADIVLPFRSAPNEFQTLNVTMSKAWEGIFGNVAVPEELATPPGAEFVVSKIQIQKRSPEEYSKFWTWLNQTDMDDDTAGLVFEYLWPVIFGRESVFCPKEKQCECEVYGIC